MSTLKRTNSLWQLFGLIVLWWGLYVFSVVANDSVVTFKPILILSILSLLMIYSNWSNCIEVVFREEFFELKHFLATKPTLYNYSDITYARIVFTRVVGNRLIIKYKTSDGTLNKFALYKPDEELIEFIRTHVNSFERQVS